MKIVASDLEGTLTAAETWQGMRDYLLKNGHERVFRRFFLQRLPQLLLFKLKIGNERRFKERWLVSLLHLFASFSHDEMAAMGEFVTEKTIRPSLREAVVTELQAHQANGRTVVIVSGMFQPILTNLAQKLGMEAIGTPLAYENGRFTGQTAAPLNIGSRKVAQLQPYLVNGRLAAAYGDTWRDIPMLELADNPVAVYPDDQLRETAVARGWRILGK